MEEKTPSSASALPAALLVEDESAIRDCVSLWLVELGWQVTAVPSVDDALRHAQRATFDVAILDVNLQDGGNGVSLAAQLETVAPELPIVFATVLNDLPPRTTMRPNVQGYIVKPYRRRDLRRVLRAVPYRQVSRSGSAPQ